MPTREETVHALCAAVDAGDAKALGKWFADDASYRFARSSITGSTWTSAPWGSLGRPRDCGVLMHCWKCRWCESRRTEPLGSTDLQRAGAVPLP
jgi:hypothetical protein